MKRAIYLVLLAGLFSCSKSFLEIVPKGSLLATTTADYDLLMNSKKFYDLPNVLPTISMGDDVSAEQQIIQNMPARFILAFRWEPTWYLENEVAWEFSNYTSGIYVCNKVINEVMASTDGTESQKNILRAEAMANRAWYNFQLVNLYARPYLEASAGTDPGFPIITTADVTQSYDRGTVQQTYDFIISDLQEAIPLLPPAQNVKTRMSRAAAKAILGKVYVFMGRYNEALIQFNSAFEDLAGRDVQLYNYNVAFAPNGAFLPIGFFGPHYPGINNTDFTESLLARSHAGGSSTGQGFGIDGLSLDTATAALFSSSDLRLKLFSGAYFDGTPLPDGRKWKYAQQYVRVGMQLQDLYLLRAEVKARLNDLQGAITDVEYLRNNRMPTADAIIPSNIAASQSDLIRFIIDERRREFAMEGYRWFDMRRLSVDPLFAGKTYRHIMYSPTAASTVYTLAPDRLVLKFPISILSLNPGMSDNP